ncbi:hypothetical protein [Sphingomonas soli]|uniref:hypothetical protein n=1 Tax=Sphingomonas soli TaxID=266127 RepID=UPI0034E2A888
MKMLAKPLLCACLAAMAPAAVATHLPHVATSQDGQGRPGVSVREIERRVIPRMPGAQYLGFDYDPSTNIYTLKFLRNGSVIWVDVDGRTGNIVRSSGN